jgi:hypothetical protein
VQVPAKASPIAPVFVLPISVASAGSGGGGGGDRFEITGPISDDQGGGGGGGGGGVRFTSIGNITLGPTAIIRCDGANGALGSAFFAGSGGGGSGGEIWIQSLSEIVVSTMAEMTVNPGLGARLCGNQASGMGGWGLIQMEDSDGQINVNFGSPLPGSPPQTHILALPSGTGGAIAGVVESTFFDTGSGGTIFDPTLVQATTEFGSNPAPGSQILIEFQAAPESLSGGTPDLTHATPWVPTASIEQINNNRFIRFRVTLRYDAPNGTATGTLPTNTFPSLLNLSIGFSSPC